MSWFNQYGVFHFFNYNALRAAFLTIFSHTGKPQRWPGFVERIWLPFYFDFEKAYDQIDWGFLEGTLSRFGFEEEQWIRGIAALYRSASSQVLLAGGRGPNFDLSRSMRQGCPLAPFLFLFFAEVMCTFLATEDVGLGGLQMPIQEEALLDAKFADATSLYL